MNFDTVTNTPCIAGTGTGPNGQGSGTGSVPTNPQCQDAAFAAANPQICGSYLILKPAASIISVLGSVQFNVFLYQNGVENQLDTGLLFGSSDVAIFVVGASSGNGTGLKPGNVVVTATYQGMSATAEVTVVDSTIGCSQTPVATAIVIDDSLSMSQSFGGSYRTLLDAAKAFALAYAGSILQVNGQPKDSVSIFSFDDVPDQISSGFITNITLLATQINSVSQSQGDTDIASAVTAAAAALVATTAAMKVMLVISDGQETDSPTEQDVLTAASSFTNGGGILICIGIRANGPGFDLLERMATGGFFINCLPSNVADALGGLSYLKSAVCAGQCVPLGDFYESAGALDYSDFLNWSVIAGQCNLLGNGFIDLLPGNGLYVELAENNKPATLQSIDKFPLNPGDTYEIQFSLAGNNETYTPSAGQQVRVYIQDANSGQILLDHTVSPAWNTGFQTYSFSFTANYAASVQIYFQQIITAGYIGSFAGNLLDDIIFQDLTTLVTLLDDNFDDENIVYVPPACGPSAALPALTDPLVPGLMFINYAGGSQLTAETYKYAVSYKTQQGETNLSPVASTASLAPVTMTNQATLLSNIFPNPNVYPPDRILSIRIWRNDASASSTLYLLAEISPENINYIDLLDHTQFAAIADPSIVAPVSNTTAVTQGELGFGLAGCYEPVCEPAIAVGAQSSDPNPLPNIETGSTGGGGVFNSTQQVCLSCPQGQTLMNLVNADTQANLTPTADGQMWNFGSQIYTDKLCFTFGSIGTAQNLTLAIYGSNDGVTWTPINIAPTWYNGYSIVNAQGTITGNSIVMNYGALSTCIGYGASLYQYFKFTYDKTQWILTLASIEELQQSSSSQVCESATATSYISQQDADAKATAAATQLCNQALQGQCFVAFTSTKSYTATCPCGEAGQPQTATQSYTSFISQADADAHALSLAQAAANALLVCNQSNNGQQMTLGPNAIPASIYPSVQYVTGLTGTVSKVTVNINSFSCQYEDSMNMLLMSPSGRIVALKVNAGEIGEVIRNISFTFDDAAATFIPSNAPILNNTSYKPTNGGSTGGTPPGCVSGSGWLDTLAGLIGDVKNGAWSLWVYNATDYQSPNNLTTIGSWSVNIT